MLQKCHVITVKDELGLQKNRNLICCRDVRQILLWLRFSFLTKCSLSCLYFSMFCFLFLFLFLLFLFYVLKIRCFRKTLIKVYRTDTTLRGLIKSVASDSSENAWWTLNIKLFVTEMFCCFVFYLFFNENLIDHTFGRHVLD